MIEYCSQTRCVLVEKTMPPYEIYLNDMLEELIINNLDEVYHCYISFLKNEEKLFLYNERTGDFWCHSQRVWDIFELKHSLDYYEIQNLIKCKIEKRFKIKNINPIRLPSNADVWKINVTLNNI